MENIQLGNIYFADRIREDGTLIKSVIDHIYTNQTNCTSIKVKKMLISATDHMPIIAEVEGNFRKKSWSKKLTKRSMKNFTQVSWNECLREQEWEKLGLTEDRNEMAKYLNASIIQELDKCAPIKVMKDALAHKFGLSEKTKTLITERDKICKKTKQAFTQ